MSLFGSIQLANNALQANQIGLQVVGQNIANANTPGYSREEVILTPAPTQRQGSLLLGLGVEVHAVVQVIDEFLEQRLRGASSDGASSDIRQQVYAQLESTLGELSDTDLSTSLNKFFSSISDVLNQPDSDSVRNLAVLQGKTLTGDLNRLAARVADARSDLNTRVIDSATDINRLTEAIRNLNIRIASTEGGGTSASDAVGLRDQRNQALADLAKLIDVRVSEQTSGSVNVFAGGEFLVFEGAARSVKAELQTDRGLSIATLKIAETDSTLTASSGKLAGLTSARDEILGGFLDTIDNFASTLAHEFNKVYSAGQGLKGYSTITSDFAVADVDEPLDAAGLKFAPTSGQFRVLVLDKQSGLTQSTDIAIDLNGLDDNDTTLTSLAAKLNSINGLSATITDDRRLKISSTSSNLEFAFAGVGTPPEPLKDTSGVLASLGINTFFHGTTALDIAVSEVVAKDPAKFAASQGGIGADTENAVALADFLSQPLDSANGATLGILHDRLVGEVTQGSSVAKAVADGFRTFEETLKGQQLATSGVSLDEEAVRMITYQRSYQASARFITVLNDLLDVLVNL